MMVKFKLVQILTFVLWLLQIRAQSLIKQLHDLFEQVEQTYVEMKTFDNLRQHEIGAVPKRLEVSYWYMYSVNNKIVYPIKFVFMDGPS